MNYCIPFNRESKYLDTIDELVINYNQDVSEPRLQSFIDMHPDQIITLDMGMVAPGDGFVAAVAKLRDKSKFSIRLARENAAALEIIPKLGINWYFTNAALTYDDIYTYAEAGAKEFFIGPQLGFDLEHCKIVANNLNMKVRSVYAYSILDSEIYKDYWQFFIRPEDIDLYGQYIDTIEFYGKTSVINVLVRVYQDKKWDGPLSEIIPMSHIKFDSRYMLPHWGQRRMNCNRKCMYSSSSTCNMCEIISTLSQTLEKAKISIPINLRQPKTESKKEEIERPKQKPNF